MNLGSLKIFLLIGTWNFYSPTFLSPKVSSLLEISVFYINYLLRKLHSLLFPQSCGTPRFYKKEMKTPQQIPLIIHKMIKSHFHVFFLCFLFLSAIFPLRFSEGGSTGTSLEQLLVARKGSAEMITIWTASLLCALPVLQLVFMELILLLWTLFVKEGFTGALTIPELCSELSGKISSGDKMADTSNRCLKTEAGVKVIGKKA